MEGRIVASTCILKTIVGSVAHGLATSDSDTDYRGVFVVPTREILCLGGKHQSTQWVEGNIDDTSWEVAHFLHLATKCNPTVLETFLAPVVETSTFGDELRSLFPFVWNARDVRNAFVGYGLNQRKKFLDDRDKKPAKFAVAYLRTLFQAHEMLTRGTFTIRIADSEIGETLRRWRRGDYSVGEVIQTCYEWEQRVSEVELGCFHVANLEPVNDFLLRLRKANW